MKPSFYFWLGPGSVLMFVSSVQRRVNYNSRQCMHILPLNSSSYLTHAFSQDILDPDVFWEQELLRVCKDRLFGCSIYELKRSDGGPVGDTVSGTYKLLFPSLDSVASISTGRIAYRPVHQPCVFDSQGCRAPWQALLEGPQPMG